MNDWRPYFPADGMEGSQMKGDGCLKANRRWPPEDWRTKCEGGWRINIEMNSPNILAGTQSCNAVHVVKSKAGRKDILSSEPAEDSRTSVAIRIRFRSKVMVSIHYEPSSLCGFLSKVAMPRYAAGACSIYVITRNATANPRFRMCSHLLKLYCHSFLVRKCP